MVQSLVAFFRSKKPGATWGSVALGFRSLFFLDPGSRDPRLEAFGTNIAKQGKEVSLSEPSGFFVCLINPLMLFLIHILFFAFKNGFDCKDG